MKTANLRRAGATPGEKSVLFFFFFFFYVKARYVEAALRDDGSRSSIDEPGSSKVRRIPRNTEPRCGMKRGGIIIATRCKSLAWQTGEKASDRAAIRRARLRPAYLSRANKFAFVRADRRCAVRAQLFFRARPPGIVLLRFMLNTVFPRPSAFNRFSNGALNRPLSGADLETRTKLSGDRIYVYTTV